MKSITNKFRDWKETELLLRQAKESRPVLRKTYEMLFIQSAKRYKQKYNENFNALRGCPKRYEK